MSIWKVLSLLPPLLIIVLHVHVVQGISRYNQPVLASSASLPAISRYHGSHRQRSTTTASSNRRRGSYVFHNNGRMGGSTCSSREDHYLAVDPLERTLPASTRSNKKAETKTAPAEKQQSQKRRKAAAAAEVSSSEEDDPFAQQRPMTSAEIYDSLGPVGKCVAGSVEIAVSTLSEYVTGFVAGYLLGSITDVPAFVFQKVDPNQKLQFFQELSQRYGRMHAKSFRWAKSWGGISAAFGGFRVATRVIRGGKDDEWNTIISSAAAGAFFARNEGPQGMLRGALLYGGLMYVLSGNVLGGKKEPFQYRDQPIDF